jgi:hypothetical protein
MACSHRGLHRITSRYDRKAGTLIYVRVCERCGKSLSEVRRMPYRPEFQPLGGDHPTAA